MTYPQGLAGIAKSLKEAGIKVVVVVVGDADKGLENVRPLASGDKFILVVGSPDRLKIMVQPAVDKIMQGDGYLLTSKENLSRIFNLSKTFHNDLSVRPLNIHCQHV